MLWQKVCFSFFLISTIILSAQKKTDFEIMLENSMEKLYQDPDASIKSTKNISVKPNEQHQNLILKSILAEAYTLQGNYPEAVKMALENINQDNYWQKQDLFLISLAMIQQYQNLGLYEQAGKIITDLLKNTNADNQKTDQPLMYAKLYQLQARNFYTQKQYDKALLSMQTSQMFCKSETWNTNFISIENQLLASQIYLEKRDFSTSNKILDDIFDTLKQDPNLDYFYAATYNQQSKLFFQQQDYPASVNALKSALAKIESKNYLVLKNKIYARLALSYLALKDTVNYEEFEKKHQETKTSLSENKKEATRRLLQLNQDYENQNFKNFLYKKQSTFYISLSMVLAILAGFGFWYYQEFQKRKMLYKQVLFFENQQKLFSQNTPTKADTVTKSNAKKQLIIPKETEEEILQKLEKFENSKLFLDKNMSLAALATQLETNTKYLSEIINKYKEKSFTAYINELKINHIAYLLTTDTTYRQYKISYLAEIAGFTSHSTFTVVFKNVTGLSPNEYLQQMKKRKIL